MELTRCARMSENEVKKIPTSEEYVNTSGEDWFLQGRSRGLFKGIRA